MRRDEYRLPHPLQFEEQLPKLNACARVETRGRFIENKELGIMHQRPRQAEPLLHAAREVIHEALALHRQVYQR
jgi:hypothetical protein